jgi:hypothetical protein
LPSERPVQMKILYRRAAIAVVARRDCPLGTVAPVDRGLER